MLLAISKGKRSSQQFYSTKRSVVVLAAVAAATAVVVVGGTSNLGILPDPDLRRTYEPTDRTTDGPVLF